MASDRVLLSQYARARLAESAARNDVAASDYAQLLDSVSDHPTLALRAFRGGLAAGDYPLAVRAGLRLEQAGALPPDARLLLFADALLKRDWLRARTLAAAIDREGSFAFLAPVLLAWTDFGEGGGNPLGYIAGRQDNPLSVSYAAEHQALLLLALGRADAGADAIRNRAVVGGESDVALRVAAAERLMRLGRRDVARALVAGDDAVLSAARRALAFNRRLDTEVRTAPEGVAFLFARLGGDIRRQGESSLALALGRLALMLDPGHPGAGLLVAGLNSEAGNHPAAIAALQRIARDSPYAGSARALRQQVLVASGQRSLALAEAKAAAGARSATRDDHVRLGDLHASIDNHADAAESYRAAIERAEQQQTGDDALWTLWLLKGSALEQAEDWPAARQALTRAAELAPDQPVVLNYLGYAQIERRENIAEATALIERAARLRPNDSAITDSLGWAYFLGGDLDRALPALERAARGEPADPTINEHLGDAYWTAGRRIEARYAWNAAALSAEGAAAERLRAKLDTGLTGATAAP